MTFVDCHLNVDASAAFLAFQRFHQMISPQFSNEGFKLAFLRRSFP
jgi:hypothetical protein